MASSRRTATVDNAQSDHCTTRRSFPSAVAPSYITEDDAPMSDSHMHSFGAWDDALPVRTEDVLGLWWVTLEEVAPWSAMTRDDAFGNMRRVVSEFLNESRDVYGAERTRRLLHAAREHGAFRRAQQCGREDVQCEFGVVADALDAALRIHGMAPLLVEGAMALLKADFHAARLAATEGWADSGSGWPDRGRIENVRDELD